MKYCTQCGAANEDDDQFCNQCGQPLDVSIKTDDQSPDQIQDAEQTDKRQLSEDESDQLSSGTGISDTAETSAVNTESGDSNQATDAIDVDKTGAKPGDTEAVPLSVIPGQGSASGSAPASVVASRKRLYISMAAFVALVLVITCGFVAYRQLSPKAMPHVQAKTAAEAVEQLKRAGIPAKTQLQFSPKRKGSFIRLSGADKSGHLSKNAHVTVTESAGPGVPKGTIGQRKAKAVQTLKSMEVPLTVADVVSSKTDVGQVAASSPSDGQPVLDPKDGIHVGIATDKAGIPIEIAGMDKDQAQSQLKAKGYSITMQPRFSSRKNLGKIVGANPSIGQPTDAKTATLYYGVDASKKLDVLATKEDDFPQSVYILNKEANLAGQYCTEDDDCLNLDAISKDEAGSQFGFSSQYLKVRGETIPNEDWHDYLSLCTFSQDPSGCIPSNTDLDEGAGYMKNHLISGPSGAFELYAGAGLPNCGTMPADAAFCDNGTPKFVPLGEDTGFKNSGLRWKAKDFFVYMPLGAKLDQLESDEYFAGRPGFKPDADRPYLIKRDNSKYPDRSADGNRDKNPYAPTQYGKAEPFQEAPNKKNVYYLVENPIDWRTMGGNTVTQSEASNPDNRASQDFHALVGKWIWSESGDGSLISQMTIQSDGSFTGSTFKRTDRPKFMDGDADNYSGHFSKITNNSAGTKTLTLDPKSIKGVSDSLREWSGLTKTTYTFVPAGQAIPNMDEKMQAAVTNCCLAHTSTLDDDAITAEGIIFVKDKN
ncbi:zinc-ribbon domain-containing protein [uncultured Bifidobacterium sp.]|uniref:zinc-ribbon domain-containing protein n=1 Tax=uncultured Bifidobacterium sp. TaxID=165187 RepID=UPI0025D3EF74|nr:PASTA domain-containing protein [uncultured Bifidobacterium sp.]